MAEAINVVPLIAQLQRSLIFVRDFVIEKFVLKPKINAVTISVSGWSYNNNETSDYKYYYDIPAAGVTTNHIAEVNFAPVSVDIAADAEVCPTNQTLAGKIRLRAKNVPSYALTAEYHVIEGW